MICNVIHALECVHPCVTGWFTSRGVRSSSWFLVYDYEPPANNTVSSILQYNFIHLSSEYHSELGHGVLTMNAKILYQKGTRIELWWKNGKNAYARTCKKCMWDEKGGFCRLIEYRMWYNITLFAYTQKYGIGTLNKCFVDKLDAYFQCISPVCYFFFAFVEWNYWVQCYCHS